MGAFSKLWKSKDRNLYLGIGLIVVLLLGIVAYMYFNRKNDAKHDLEEESELIRAASDNASTDATPKPSSAPKETFAAPPAKPSARPAIVVFHSSSCPHCTSLLPTWEQLRQQIGKEVDVMDFEAHKEPEILQQNGIEGVPEIRYYPKGFPSKEFVQYGSMQGANRQLDSLIRFAMSHGQSA